MNLDPLRRVRDRMGPLWWYSALMFGVSRIGDIINIYIGVFLVPAVVSQEHLGALLPLANLAVFIGVPLVAVQSTALKYISVFAVAGEMGKIKRMLRDLGIATLVFSTVTAIYLWQGRTFIQERLKFQGTAVIWLICALGIMNCWAPIARISTQGVKKFYSLIISNLIAPVARLLVIVLLLHRFHIAGYLSASLASHIAVFLFLAWGLRRFLSSATQSQSYRDAWPQIMRYMLPVGLAALATSIQLTGETWIIRQRLSAADSAGYYMAAAFGRMPVYVNAALVPFLFSLVSDRFEKGESTWKLRFQSLGVVLAVGLATTAMLAVLARPLLLLHAPWRQYADYAPFVWRVTLVFAVNSLFLCHTMHENACRRFTYLWYYAPIIFLEVGGLYALMGWPFFRPWLPPGMWTAVESFISRDFKFIIAFMLGARFLTAGCIFTQVLAEWKNERRIGAM